MIKQDMKQNIIIIVALLFSLGNANAQKAFVGLELGSNIIPVENTNFGNNFQLGPYAGVSVNYKLNENFSLSSGLFFSQRKKMYFRSPLTVISPAWLSMVSSPDGTHVYEMAPTPLILASQDGRTVNIQVKGLLRPWLKIYLLLLATQKPELLFFS